MAEHKIVKKKHICHFKRITLKGKKKSKLVTSICSCKNTRYIREYDEEGTLRVQIGLLI